MIPESPSLPAAIRNSLKQLRADLDAAGLVKRLPPDKVLAWDAVVEEWAESDLPLIVRRGGHKQMCMRLRHCSGRDLAPADNSPAHWMVIQCFSHVNPSLNYIRAEIGNIPMTMRMSKEEALECDFKVRLDELEHAGRANWYLAHISEVGLGRIGPLEDAPIAKLKDHFLKLMRPSNMLLVSSCVSGLAEVDTFIS